MSPVDRAQPDSEISRHPLIPLKKKSPRVHVSGWSGSVSETSGFPTGISGTGQKFFPHEHFGSVYTGMKKINIFVIESSYFLFFGDKENNEAWNSFF